jgi:hypothetical protein
MRKYELYTTHHDLYEYHGNTEIVRIRETSGKTVRKDWIIFDTVEEAMDYFNSKCGEYMDTFH